MIECICAIPFSAIRDIDLCFKSGFALFLFAPFLANCLLLLVDGRNGFPFPIVGSWDFVGGGF
jgi:hypothetical protein